MKRTFINKGIFACIATLLTIASSFAQTITTSAVSSAAICAGSTISVGFTTTGTFPTGTEFTAQLSDATGSFTAPVSVGTDTATPISITIPSEAAAGTGYKVRVIAGTTPVTIGSASAVFTINEITAAPVIVNKNYIVNDASVSLASSVTGTGLLWYSAASGGTGSAIAPTPSTAVAGTVSYYVSQTLTAGCESPRSKIDVITAPCTPPAAPTVVNKSYIVGDAADILTVTGVTGSTFKWYESATSTAALASAPTPSTIAPGTKSYFVSQTVGGCESARAEIVVTVNACTPPAAPTVVNKSYIVGDTADILTVTGVTGSTFKWYESATGATALASAPTPSTIVPGTKSYYVTQTVANCESARAEIVVTVNACTPPAAPTVANKNYTVEDAALALTATGTSLKWYTTVTGGTGSSTAPIPSTSTVGTKSYYVTQTVANCESARAEIVVTVSACTPHAAPTVANISYTIGDEAVALTATGTNKKWYAAATGGTGSSVAPIPSTATVGTKSYYVTQTVANCESARAEIVVTVSACTPPAMPTVADVEYCITSPAVALSATGKALKWYTTASGGTALTAAPVPSTAKAGTTSYYVTQTIGCESARAKIDVIVNQTAIPVVDKDPVQYCLKEEASPLTATGTLLKWYTAATGGTGTATALTPLTTTAGTKSYYVTQTLKGCESERAEIKVIVKPISVLPTIASDTINLCQNSTATALTASGTTGAVFKWYTVATGGTALSSAPVPATTTEVSTSYYVSQISSNSCEGPRAKVTVIIRFTPPAPPVNSVSYCVGETAVPLTPAGPLYKWYSDETGGTGSVNPPTPKTTTAATIPYYLTQSNTYATLSCESPRAKLNVFVNPTPAALATTSEVLCQERENKTYTFPVKAASGNTIRWYTAATGTDTTKTPSVNLTTAGTSTYYTTQVTNKGCESPARVIQKIRVKPLPAIPGVANIEYCQFVAASPLTATWVTDAVPAWYGTNATGGTATGTAPTPSTSEGGTTSYFVGQSLEGCLSDRAKIDVKINTTPKPVTTTYLAYCQGVDAPILNATGTDLKWYRNATDTQYQENPFSPYTNKVEDYSFYVSQTTTTNGCESPKEEIKIHIKALPSATISGNTTIDLGQTASITLKFTGDGPWIYILSNGTTDTTDQATTTIAVTPGITTSYIVTEVSNACGKGTPNGSALVTVKIPTIVSGIPSVSEACAGKSFGVPFQQSGDFPAGNTFKVQISLTNTDKSFYTIPSVATSNQVTATFPDTTKGGNYFIRVVSSGDNPDLLVRGNVSTVGISASPLTIATLTGSQTILAGESATLKAEFTGKAPWSFMLNNGVSDSLITTSTTPYSFKLATKSTTTYTISSVSNSCGEGKGVGSARVQVDAILGVEPPVASSAWLNVYPTVVEGKCIVEITGAISSKEAKVQVIDMNGRPLFDQTIRKKTTDLDFSAYPSGLYLLQIQNGNLNSVRKVMKP